MTAASQGYEAMHVVRFSIGGRDFALDVMAVHEVLQPRSCEPVPGQPAFIEGLIALRGEYLPLIDLRTRFAKPGDFQARAKGPAKLLIVTSRGRHLALAVDSVGEVERIEAARLRKPPVDNNIGAPGSLLAVAQTETAMVLVLACDALLSDSEIAALPA